MLLTSTQLHNLFVHMCVYYGARVKVRVATVIRSAYGADIL